ncbi:hypothetical protein BC833DRAFT_610450, partial [Globomyces pollinis-pini]
MTKYQISVRSVIKVILEVTFSCLGIYGSYWTFQQYRNNRIGKFIGIIIVTISLTDIINVLSYFIDFVIILILPIFYNVQAKKPIMDSLEVISWATWSWAALSSSMLSTILALNSLVITTFNGTTQESQICQYGWPLFALLMPLLVLFIPYSIFFQVSLFDVVNGGNGTACRDEQGQIRNTGCYILMNSVFFCVLATVCINLISYTTILFTLRFKRRQKLIGSHGNSSITSQYTSRDGSANSRQSRKRLVNLVMTYTLYVIISWIPFLIVYYLQWIIFVPTIHTVGEIIDAILTPSRGYFHALAISISHAFVQHPNPFSSQSNILKILCLKSIAIPDQEGHISFHDPKFDFTFDAGDYFESQVQSHTGSAKPI